ncbi:TetR family transcriptional regulator [Kitasatospora viridis]|uniref:TetR family transcriptional regulator n=1 Tax=Kitasatospora viridis TaxID=281105 RepID=A0A561SDS9_9ACTN|nr:TetR family transcriptional regulator [Kitasatospora viridis]TWF72998.1 TetR family transcriptional regulator [Kitasatospora viridis]
MRGEDEEIEPGMRDRKKARTRDGIRTAAFDLFEEQGFERTTVQQICRRADVAHRTFFRYYPTKEALLFGWDFGRLLLDAFAGAPAGLDLWAAMEHALTSTDGQWEESAEHAARRRRLRGEYLPVQSVRNYALIVIDTLTQRTAELAADRLGVDPGADLRPTAFATLFAGIVRGHVLDGGRDTDPLPSWAEAYRAVLRS